MTFTEILVIGSGLAIGYWLVAVFIPNARSSREADAEAAMEDAPQPTLGGTPRWRRVWRRAAGKDHLETATAFMTR